METTAYIKTRIMEVVSAMKGQGNHKSALFNTVTIYFRQKLNNGDYIMSFPEVSNLTDPKPLNNSVCLVFFVSILISSYLF